MSIQNKLGKDTIVRGTGAPNSAAVSILEHYYKGVKFSSAHSVKGLVRMVKVGERKTLFDITVSGMPIGKYFVSARTSGCLIDGPLSTGDEFQELGTITVEQNKTGSSTDPENTFGQSFITRNIDVTELVGRSIAVSKNPTPDADSIVGVVARSAGVWENDKTVCSCSGKTVWEERKDAITKGVL